MSDTDNLKIEVSIRITRRSGYDTIDVAAAKVEDSAPWDEIKPTAVHRAVDAVLEDVTERIGRQLKAEHTKRRAAQAAAEAEEEAFRA